MSESRVCPKCSVDKPLDEFGSNGARLIYCRPCKRQYDRDYWSRTKDLRNARKRENSAKTRTRNFEFVYSYLLEHPCVDCGEDDLVVLEFDHRDPETKKFNIAEAVNQCRSLSAIEEEIAVCDVRCANCHRRRTAEMLDYRRWRV